MIKRLIKDPYFMTGFIIVFIIFIMSITFTFIFHDDIPKRELLYNGQGQLIGKAPFSPIEYPPLGTDEQGNSLFIRLIMGAKYTIGITLIIAIFRLVISLLLGLIYGNYFIRFSKYISKIIEAFNYVPMTLLAYILLAPVIMENGVIGQFQYSPTQRIVFEIIVLTAISIPTTSLLFGNETNFVLRKEYITSVKLLGATRFYILKRHVLPHLIPKLWINFAQQIIQILVVLVHLGLLHLFFGGTNVSFGLNGSEYSSQSGEWSGLIGTSFNKISTTPWIPFGPLIMFTITLISMHLILKGLEAKFENEETPKTRARKTQLKSNSKKLTLSQNDFTLFH